MPVGLVVSATSSGDSDYMSDGVTPMGNSSGPDASSGSGIPFSLFCSGFVIIFPVSSFIYFYLFLGGTVHDFQHAFAAVGAKCTEEARMFCPVTSGGTVPRPIMVASRRSSLLNMPTTTSASNPSSHTCSSLDVGDPAVEVDTDWDVAATPTLEVHLSSCSTGQERSQSSLPSYPGLTTLGSNIDVSDLLADLPEVLRSGVTNGSLVPAYGSTG